MILVYDLSGIQFVDASRSRVPHKAALECVDHAVHAVHVEVVEGAMASIVWPQGLQF